MRGRHGLLVASLGLALCVAVLSGWSAYTLVALRHSGCNSSDDAAGAQPVSGGAAAGAGGAAPAAAAALLHALGPGGTGADGGAAEAYPAADAAADAALVLGQHRAATFGGVQAFTLPMKVTGCLDAVIYGFAKCMARPTPAGVRHHWRIIMAWHHTSAAYRGPGADKETVHHMWQFGPGDCDVPGFYLQANATEPKLALKVLVAGGMDPTLLQVMAPPSDEYVLTADGSPYSWPLAGRCVTDRAPPKEARPVFPATNFVLLAVRPLPASFTYGEYATVLAGHVAHHVAAGFDGVLAYYDSAHLSHLDRDPGFAALRSSGRLGVVVWDFTPRVAGGAATWGAQAFAISHAFLGLWGRDAALLAADLDEWLLAGPAAGGSLRGLWEACWLREMCVEVPRFTAFCANCSGRDLSVWREPDPLAHYRLVASKTGPGYKAVEYVKTWAPAWKAHSASVHYVYGCQHVVAQRRCSALLHMVNLWVTRFEPNMTDAWRLDFATLQLATWDGSKEPRAQPELEHF
ncbi:MAG: hypothetical protein J3K34DRAFT_69262 [Monoraphidium minutum]|nr:MAG: hypothetical protein J3K34DRAFT_69262 [Monoraphidium minutum]